MPSGGPVLSYAVTQGPGGQSQPFMQIIPQAPADGWSPRQIVQGFLTASGSIDDRQKVAREYLTQAFDSHWNPKWSAWVFSKGPTVKSVTVHGKGAKETAEVIVIGNRQAILNGGGSYAVSSSATASQQVPVTFELRKDGGQWRISSTAQDGPSTLPLLLTSDTFANDYQQRNLYFFDPHLNYLVPDPVYVPLQDTPVDLMNNLVDDLIKGLKTDWLHNSTQTVLDGTSRVGDVTLVGGTATVNLRGNVGQLSSTAKEQISSQLWWTLSGSGQGGPSVQNIELLLNGHPWIPDNAQGNPVQHVTQFTPPVAPNGIFYYLDSAGNVWAQDGPKVKPSLVARIGKGYKAIAVSPSPDGLDPYLAALSPDGTLSTGPLGGRLVKRADWMGAGYTSMSWDPNGNLWATTGNQIVMLATAAPGKPPPLPVAVSVTAASGIPVSGTFTALRVAPDGVRVAIIVGGSVLNFGAIYYQPSTRAASQPIIKIGLSPFSVTASGTALFTAVTWYGSDNVITLGASASPVLTEYPVSGGSSTSIPAPQGTWSIAALVGHPLIAGILKGGLMADTTLTGTWGSFPSGIRPPAGKKPKPFSPVPVYPG